MSIQAISEEIEKLEKAMEAANGQQKKLIWAELIILEEDLSIALSQA